MHKLIFSTFFLVSLSNLFGQFFDPFKYGVNDSIPFISLTESEKKENELALFENNYIWVGSLPNSNNVNRITIRHDAILINSDAALESHNKAYIPIGENDSLMTVIIRVFENGKVVKVHDKSAIREIKEEENTYKIIALEGLKKGQIIETLIIRIINYSDYATYQLQRTYPVKKSEFCMNIPANVKFALKSYPNQLEVKDSVINDERRYQWITFNDMKPFDDEIYCFEGARKIRIETAIEKNISTGKKFMSWADKGRNSLENLLRSTSSEEKFIKKLIKKEKWETLNGMALLFAIDNKIKSEFNISKSYPYIPDVEKNFELRFADEYSIVRIYLMIYQQLNIEWELVFTVWKGKKFFDPDFASSSFIEDPLFYFPSYKIYSDPADKGSRPGDIGSLYRDQNAMFIKPVKVGDAITGLTKIGRIPALHMDSVLRINKVVIRWSPDEEEITINTRFEGNRYATDDRKLVFDLIGEEKTKEIIEETVRNGKKGGTFTLNSVENIKLNDPTEYFKPLILDYTWKTQEYTENTGEHMIIKFGELIGQQVQLYDKETRVNPIDVSYPHIAIHEIRVVIPEGYIAKGYEGLNRDLAFKNEKGEDLFGIRIDVGLEGQEVVLKVREYYAKTEYAISDYSKFRQVINAASDVNKFTILLQKKP